MTAATVDLRARFRSPIWKHAEVNLRYCVGMHRSDAIARLQTITDRLRAVGIRALYMFGSVARDEAIDTSDVDVFVDPDYEHFGFVELIRIEEFLSAELGCKVDLTTREGLHPLLRSAIEGEAIRVL